MLVQSSCLFALTGLINLARSSPSQLAGKRPRATHTVFVEMQTSSMMRSSAHRGAAAMSRPFTAVAPRRIMTGRQMRVVASAAPTSSVQGFKETPLQNVMENGELSQFPAAPGVYAVFDKSASLQYIGLSRRVRQLQHGRTMCMGIHVACGCTSALCHLWHMCAHGHTLLKSACSCAVCALK